MSGTPTLNDPPHAERPPARPVPGKPGNHPGRRKRRGLRIALVSLTSVLALAAAVAVGGVLVLNHLASSIRRVPVTFAKLAVADRPLGGPGGQSMTVLITAAGIGPTGGSVASSGGSGLIMLLHINANQQAGGVVSIPPQAVVAVPGYGTTQIQNVLGLGGPSLLVQTVEQLTHVQIEHYARIDFSHVASMVDAVGGVDVVLPAATTSFGHLFSAGSNHLDGLTALYYARQPSLTEEGRVLRQQSLIRAELRKIANDHLLVSPLTMIHVLAALTAMLTVDSNFTNSELAALASQLRGLGSSAGTFVTAPAHTFAGQVFLDGPISGQLWRAIQQDSIAAFARHYPFTVTPEEVP
jgi:LCP family protein required for cell wall assembly